MKTSQAQAARSWLASRMQVESDIFAELTDQQLEELLSKLYVGGLDRFFADNRVRESKEVTPIKLRATIERLVGQKIRLGVYDKLIGAKITETQVAVSLEVHRVAQGSRRDKITASGVKLLVWNLTGEAWVPAKPITVWNETREEHVRFGRVRTPEWAAAQEWQWVWCYRPGTAKTPLDGPCAPSVQRRPAEAGTEYESVPVYTSAANYGADLKGWK